LVSSKLLVFAFSRSFVEVFSGDFVFYYSHP